MKEIKSILEAYDLLVKGKTLSALATVVRVEGSSYRRTGARMLVQDNGIWVGGISGGCLEGDALKKARWAILKGKASLITYDTTKNDAQQIGVGLGCNGIIDVLFTPLDYLNPKNPIEILRSCLLKPNQTRVLINITGLEGYWSEIELGQVLEYESSDDLQIFFDPQIIQEIGLAIHQNLEKGSSSPIELQKMGGSKLKLFIEILPPEIHIICWGNQYDVKPLLLLAKELGWRRSMVSDAFRVDRELKKILDKIIEDHTFPSSEIHPFTALVLMAHDYALDKDHLSRALKTSIPYIGILGPRVRAEKMFLELVKEGESITMEDQERIFAPAGLDLGAIHPEEIALSILAEIRATFSKRKGGFLKYRIQTIHER